MIKCTQSLDEALADDSPLKPFLNAELLEEYWGFGGVRLEDVVAITANGCVNYTLCPHTVNEIEHVMAGGKWPPAKDDSPELLREIDGSHASSVAAVFVRVKRLIDRSKVKA
jgi:Xaa-Pro dipeptidase